MIFSWKYTIRIFSRHIMVVRNVAQVSFSRQQERSPLPTQSGVRLVIANTEKVRSEKRKKNILNCCSQLLSLFLFTPLIKCFFSDLNSLNILIIIMVKWWNYFVISIMYVVVTFVRGVEKISTLWKCLRLY